MFRRLYHVSSISYSIKKQGVKLSKMINPGSKRRWYPMHTIDRHVMPTVKNLTKTTHEPGKSGVRRMAMLNKMFMKYVTDLMSTGTMATNFLGRGIEISKVQITPNFRSLNVFWVCKGDFTDEETEAILNKTAGPLRHELSTLRVMGEVPYIFFVKDKNESKIVDLDRRLARADYGEDYTPTEIGHLLKTEFTLDTKLSPEMKAKIKQLEDELYLEDEPIPEMTHNIFGLDHAKIMNRLLAARKKSKDAWSNLEATDSSVISYRIPTISTSNQPETDPGNQKKDLAEFLLRRQILENKLHKRMLNSRENWEVSLDEDDEHSYTDDDDDDCYEDDDDYYRDDERLQNEDEIDSQRR